MTQRCTRYFFLLNLFGFFFLSANALAAEPVAGEGCTSSTCVLSCSSVEAKPAFTAYDLQPILGAAVARDLDEASSTTDDEIVAEVVTHRSLPILTIAPKQSPPVFA